MPYTIEPETTGARGERDPLVGTLLDERYLIEERIATGGFGAIYRARTADGALVALKVLHPRLTGDPNMVARFRREGATLIQLHDPHTVTTFAVGETDGTLYIAMELLSGESLHDRLRRLGALPWQPAVAIARAVCSSLAEAHAIGVVHRDLKPANIHITGDADDERVKVLDFGIVKIARGSSIDDGNELTYAGHMIGTYDYMSPEQIVGGAVRDLSDIYALGVVMYETVTGRRPFPKVTSPASMMTALLTQTPIPPSLLAAIPRELDRIVMRCLAREPEDRFASIAEVARALDALVASSPTIDEVTVVHPTYDGGDPGERPTRSERAVTVPIADDERTWIDDGLVIDAEAPTVPHYHTLQGVAVATERGDRRTPLPAPTVAPLGWLAPPRGWVPPPSIPVEPMARGSSPHMPTPSYLLWVALAIVCIAAILLVALV